jgi:serine/threonine protein kinase
MAEETSEFEPGERLDRFRLEKLLGTGAFGEVWLAMDEGEHGFRKRVALKILARDQSDRRVEALLREARICGALNHPNVVDVSGVMRIDRCSFIIMEYVDGETLSAMWRDLEYLGLRFPRAIIVDIGVAVSEALYHGWKAVDAEGQPLKIVHRDLKPANIMVSDRGIVKVADFGIAKVAPDHNVTRQGKLKGTPSYMAPELWTGTRDFRPAIDLWSLGVILWELCTGKRFFGRASIAEIFDIVTNRQPGEEIEEVRPYFPQLVPVLGKLLQRDPDLRYQDGLTLARDLRLIRNELGPAGDLLQFNRLLRAGRLDPSERDGSLAVLPALPPDAEDWGALLAVAAGEEMPTAPWDEDALSKKVPVVIGPDEPARVASPGSVTKADAIPPPDDAPPPPAGQPSGGIDTVPIKRASTAPLAPERSTRAFQDALPEPGQRPPFWKHPMLWFALFGILAVVLLAALGLGTAPK